MSLLRDILKLPVLVTDSTGHEWLLIDISISMASGVFTMRLPRHWPRALHHD